MFHRNHIPLYLWFIAISLLDERDWSTRSLAEQLKVSYHTAWIIKDKLQTAENSFIEKLKRTASYIRRDYMRMTRPLGAGGSKVKKRRLRRF
jgi:hypothetical protein